MLNRNCTHTPPSLPVGLELAGACYNTQATQRWYVSFKHRLLRGADWSLCAPWACLLQLQLQLGGNTGKRRLDVPSAIRGVLGEQPSTALQRRNMSIQMNAGLHRQLHTQMLSYCKRDWPNWIYRTTAVCLDFS